jgi:basic membrane protein A
MSVNVEKQLTAVADGTFKGENALLKADTDSTGFVSAEGRQQLTPETVEKLKAAYELVKNGTIVPAANFNKIQPDSFPGLDK